MSVMEIYYRALSDLPLAAVVFGIDASATHGQHFPRPAEIRERVREERKRRQLEKSTREALAEGPGEPIALPAGHGPQMMAPAKPVERIKLTETLAPAQAAFTKERQRRAGETWDQSMARLRRQRHALGLTDADVEAATKECISCTRAVASQETSGGRSHQDALLALAREANSRGAAARLCQARMALPGGSRSRFVRPRDRARVARWHRIAVPSGRHREDARVSAAR